MGRQSVLTGIIKQPDGKQKELDLIEYASSISNRHPDYMKAWEKWARIEREKPFKKR